MKPLTLLLVALIVASLSFAVGDTKTTVDSERRPVAGVALPDDPIMNAIEQRFGRPDRVTGSGRAFLHYDLSNGDTVTFVVSGDKIIGLTHQKKQE